MAHTEGEMGRNMQPESVWLQATATTANTYPKIKRQNATAGHTHNEGPGHAPLWLLALEPVSETTADHNSYGFRPMRRA